MSKEAAELTRALNALTLEVDAGIVDDIRRRVSRALAAVERETLEQVIEHAQCGDRGCGALDYAVDKLKSIQVTEASASAEGSGGSVAQQQSPCPVPEVGGIESSLPAAPVSSKVEQERLCARCSNPATFATLCKGCFNKMLRQSQAEAEDDGLARTQTVEQEVLGAVYQRCELCDAIACIHIVDDLKLKLDELQAEKLRASQAPTATEPGCPECCRNVAHRPGCSKAPADNIPTIADAMAFLAQFGPREVFDRDDILAAFHAGATSRPAEQFTDKDWIIQLKWQAAGYRAAAGQLMRVFGSDAEMYANTIRAMAESSDKTRERIERGELSVTTSDVTAKGDENG